MHIRTYIAHLVSLSCVMVSLFFFSPPCSALVTERKPDLQAFPAYDVALVINRLIFSTRTWNSGDGPLELVAGETNSGEGKQNVYQRVYLSDGGYYDRLAGTFVWHPDHDHFHFEDYARYSLQPVNASGLSERIGSKVSFCVMDTDAVNLNLPSAPHSPIYSVCGKKIQGMSVGWGDTYGRNLPGQLIDVTGLPDGDYKLVIEADPKNRLIELNEGNNTSCMLIHLNVSSQSLVVLDPNSCTTPPTVSGISPNSASRGSVVSATISGSGFVSGLTISFENGNGPRPIASNVKVESATKITATVTVKKGKAGSDPVWDLRVGNGARSNAFTVK
jgi:hypothetical protein